ncbi:hypothetical protein [Corynebacterium sp. A21]|uniref:hypothetical protein n=1 Tax=Corynebacterium sp. A21 TaxID=3457318 RepID=UPI003FD4001C
MKHTDQSDKEWFRALLDQHLVPIVVARCARYSISGADNAQNPLRAGEFLLFDELLQKSWKKYYWRGNEFDHFPLRLLIQKKALIDEILERFTPGEPTSATDYVGTAYPSWREMGEQQSLEWFDQQLNFWLYEVFGSTSSLADAEIEFRHVDPALVGYDVVFTALTENQVYSWSEGKKGVLEELWAKAAH